MNFIVFANSQQILVCQDTNENLILTLQIQGFFLTFIGRTIPPFVKIMLHHKAFVRFSSATGCKKNNCLQNAQVDDEFFDVTEVKEIVNKRFKYNVK